MTQQQRELENKYREYAKRYIERITKERYGKDQLNVMIDEIERAITENRNISIFINPDGIDETDKEKMLTFHILARDLGYKASQWNINYKTGCASMIVKN